MSLVKELSLKHGKLYQYPVEAVRSLRSEKEAVTYKPETNNTYELELTFDSSSVNELLLFADNKGNGLAITVDTKMGTILIDRSKAGSNMP